MNQYISMTSGSKSVLLKIKKKYLTHNLNLYKSSTEDTFSLIDWLPKRLIFKAPITYQIIRSSNSNNEGPFVNLYYFTLSKKGIKILTAYVNKQLETDLPSQMTRLFLAQDVKNSSKVIIGSVWSSNRHLSQWLRSSFISLFLNNQSNYGFHNNLNQIR